ISVKCDLDLDVYEWNGEYVLNCTYAKDLFIPDSIKYLLKHYSHTVQQMVDNPDKNIGSLKLIDEKEKEKVTKEFNTSSVKDNIYSEKTVVEYFEEQVTKTPENIALVYEEEELTYSELNR